MVDEASQRGAVPTASGDARPGLRVWFAPPAAADSLDPLRLAGQERAEYERLHRAARRLDWLSSRALLKAAAPAGHESRSLSHSRGYAALCIGPGEARVGIDVECLATRDYASLARIAYAPEETDWLAGLEDDTQQCAAFYELWTLKEACIKALRLSLLDGLRTCRFVDARGHWSAAVPASGSWQATVFAPRPDVRLALVAAVQTSRPDCYEWPGRRVAWPVVRRLVTTGGGAPAC